MPNPAPSPTPPAPVRRPPRRALWFMLLLMLSIVAAVAGVSRFVLRSADKSIRADLEQTLAARAGTQATRLAVWYGALYDQTATLADSDVVRLFASEADANRYDASALLRMSQSGADEDNLAFRPDADELDGQTRLGGQSPLMRRQFEDFLSRRPLTSAALFNSRGEMFLTANVSAPGAVPAAASPLLTETTRQVAATGIPRVLPARLDAAHRLVMDMALPVFAPLYVDASGTKGVGALVVGVDLSSRLQAPARPAEPDKSAREPGRLLQIAPDGVEELTVGSAPVPLPGWNPDATGGISLAARSLPGEQEQVYSLALPVPGTPLLAEQDVPVGVADARYHAFRRSVLLSAALLTVVAALLLVMLWWWLLGRRERAVAAELRDLYETVTRQNRIIDGVNTTMEDGIALSDRNGRFQYANQAFATLAGETPSALLDKNCSSLSRPDVSRSVQAHTEAVQRADAPLTFTENLEVDGQCRRYQVACSPFRNERGDMIGVVSVYRDITELLAAQERARHMVSQTVHVFVRAIEAVDPYLRGQSARTGELAAALAEQMNMPEHDETLRTAANLSQIGMIQLPRELLTKTGMLTPEERSRLEKHVDYARDALEGIDFGMPVLEAITQMHERLDGSGYPRRLHGDAIGMDGRILAVAGTFCAMLRPRSYRQARNVGEALAILSVTPYRYDPRVVDALRAYLDTPGGRAFLDGLIAA